MNIIKRLLWVVLALISAVYAVVIGGCYLIGSPFVWLLWWVISGKSFKIGDILMHLLMPTFIVFDQMEKIYNIN